MSNEQNRRVRALGGAVATAAIPAVILGSLATPAVAAPQPPRGALQPKIATPSMMKAAEARISAHLVAAHVPTSIAPLAKKSGSVTVKSGDTLSHIAVRTGVSVSELKSANGLRSDTIFPGQKLRLDGGSTQAAPKSTSGPKASSSAAKYTVVANDTLGGIAHKLGVSLSEARSAAGNPAGDLIHIGQTLKFSAGGGTQASAPRTNAPTKAPAGGSSAGYTVRSGDTASGIALRHNMSVASFMSLNGLGSSTVIYPGQVLKVSGSGSNQQPAKAPQASAKAPAARQGSYTVVSGDTLIGIANKTKTPVNTLLRLNGNLSYGSVLSIGQRIKTSGSAAASGSSNSSVQTQSSKPLVGNTFLGRTYSSGTVNSANANKQALLAAKQPSRAQMQALVAQTARQMGVDPSLALAHAFQESSFNMASVSPANAVGVMQVIPSAGEWAERLVGRQLNLLDPKDNVTAGIAIIRHHQNNSPSKEIGIASYYQGATGVKKYGMYPDTKRYVSNIVALQNRF